MKVPGNPHSPAATPFPAPKKTHYSDINNLVSTKFTHNSVIKPVRRRTSLIHLKRNGAPVRRRTETQLRKWKVEDKVISKNVAAEEEEEGEVVDSGRRRRRRRRKSTIRALSSRKLAAGLWRIQLPQTVDDDGGSERRRDRLGFKPGVGHVGFPFIFQCNGNAYSSEGNDLLQSPSPLNGATNDFFRKMEPSVPFPNPAMEGATKWDPVPIYFNPTNEVHQIYSHMKRIDQQASAVSVVSVLEVELEQARARIDELVTERRTTKKKLEHFLRKVSEEKAAWRSREHEKIRAVMDDIKAELNKERKNNQRMEMVNSKLINDRADAKLTVKCYMQDYEKERKARILIEEVCNELAKEIGEDKAEVEEFKRESMKHRDEVDEERKMLQMAEVWREERVKMKLVDAKVALDDKYSQMNYLVAELEKFLKSRTIDPNTEDLRNAEFLLKAVTDVSFQDVKEFTYEPPDSDDIFSVFEDLNFGEPNERKAEPCSAYSPTTSHASKIHGAINMNKNNNRRYSNSYVDEDSGVDDDESGWETASHVEDQGSSYSPETSITEISEVCSESRQKKKGSSIARLWRSVPKNGENYKTISVDGMIERLSNGRLSTDTKISSPGRGSRKGELGPDLVGQWSSPDSGNLHSTRGMKGCIEWPLGTHKNDLKAKLESQKVQIRHVLKQKI